MDIDLLSKMIIEAVMTRDEVSLPGLGCFVTEEVAASFSDRGFTINPPYRKLSFRLHHSEDNSLVEALSAMNNIPPASAAAEIVDFLARLKEVLKQRKVIIFPGLGRLRATRENHFFFVSDENVMIYPDGFGLEPVSLKSRDKNPVLKEVSEQTEALGRISLTETESPAAETVEAPEEKGRGKLSLFVRILVIALALLLLVCAVLVILSRFAPELLDKILYTKEQLQILYY